MTTPTEAIITVLNYYVPENMIPYPNELDNSWYFNGPNLVITANTTTAPNGAKTADTVDDQDGTAASALFIPVQTIAADNTLRYASIYLKEGTATETRIVSQLSGGPLDENDCVIDWTASPPTATFNDGSGTFIADENGFYKLVMPLQNAGSNTQITFLLFPAGGTGSSTGSVIAWGMSISEEIGICDNRIYTLVMPQDSSFPSVVIAKTSQLRENTMSDSGGSGVENQRCRINIYDATLTSCEAVAEQVRLALIAAASSQFKAVQVFNLDLYEDDTHLYHVIVDYSIWYRH